VLEQRTFARNTWSGTPRHGLIVLQPTIFNTDQGSQFTSEAFTGVLNQAGIAISMDGVGRAFDNIMVERLWRTVKYEDVYLRDYQTPAEARYMLDEWRLEYNCASQCPLSACA